MRDSRAIASVALLMWSVAAGCGGTIEGGDDQPSPAGTDSDPSNPASTAKPAVPGAPGTPTKPGDPNAAGPMPLRRLTNREYNNTVRDLLGDTTQPANQFPSDRDETFVFRRPGAVAVQDAKLLRTAAEALGAAAARNATTLAPCDAAGNEPACAKTFVDGFGARAFRRPLSAAETDHLVALYTAGRTTLKLGYADTIGLLVEAMLQAPAFLYHWEVPAGPALREGTVVRLGGYEMASRLSFFLWGSMPDKDLFAAAAAGRLATAADVEAQARRMLNDAKARDTVATFFADWLALDELKDKPKDPKAYPEYNDALKAAMLDETRAFAQGVVFDGDGRWSTLLGASYSFVNQALAAVYGLPQVKGTTLQRSDLNPAQRAGFLTQPGFLALTGSADGSNPVRRGKAVYTMLLCREIPPPPANVPMPKPASAGGTTRQRFVEHDMNECAKACHGLIDPIGFAFENYDGIGKYRTTDNGQPVDSSGSVTVDGAAHSFGNALELGKALGGSAETKGCFATQWMRFALLRDETEADRASLQAAATGFGRAESSVRDLMVAVATSRSFRYRSPSAGEVLP
jgi:hypothetical protein